MAEKDGTEAAPARSGETVPSASTGAETKARQEPHGRKVVPFDPRKPSRLNRKQLENLASMFSSVLDEYAEALGRDLRCKLEVELSGIVQERFEVFMQALGRPTCIYQVRFAPWKAPALLVLDHVFVFSAVDRFLGSTGVVEIEPRELTDVEAEITGRFAEVLARCSAGAWKKIVALEPSVIGFVSDPDKVDEDGLDDVLLVATLAVKGASADFGSFTLCIPFGALEEHLERIGRLRERGTQGTGDPAAWRRSLERHLDRVEVGLPVILGESEIPLKEILDLEKDDVIVLDKHIRDPVRMSIGEGAFVEGTIGMYNDRLAMKILRISAMRPAVKEVQQANG